MEIIVKGWVDLNLEQVISTLTATFNEPLNDGEQRKVVFWVDKDREFVEEILIILFTQMII